MIVVKLGDGSLWINSPVAVSDETLNRIEAIGPIRYLVAPTTLHVWRLEQWHKRFPDDRKLGREVLATLLSWDFDKLIVAHGSCIEHDAKAFVENAFRWLSR